MQVDCVLNAGAELGEGAIWDDRAQRLWWVDITGEKLHRFDPSTSANVTWNMYSPIGCFALCEGGKLVVALSTGFHEFDPADGSLQFVSGPKPEERGHRFNDGTVDPSGRFLAGTMRLDGPRDDDTTGTLFCLEPAGDMRKVMDGFRVINGLAFAPDGRTVYASDSYAKVRTIWAWDYDLDSGDWSNRREFFDTRHVAGRPDGGAMDSDGCYWMAGVSGWQLVRITPDGKVDMEIPMPVEKPSRIAFGGTQLDTLYVTSLSVGLDPTRSQPEAGGLFALRVPGVTGLPFPRMPR